MKIVAIARRPSQPENATRALAQSSGLTLAEARMRLAPEPPALLALLADAPADLLSAELREQGLAALAIDAGAPIARPRFAAHAIAFTGDGATFTSRSNETISVPWTDLLAILPASRTGHSQVERTETSRSFAPGRAILTGGLVATRNTSKTVRTTESRDERLILILISGGRTVILEEGQIDFTCLGPRLSPSSTANMTQLAQLLREQARGAFYDDRLLRLGRRPLPFSVSESRVSAPDATVTNSSTGRTVEVLAEVMFQALLQGLLPRPGAHPPDVSP